MNTGANCRHRRPHAGSSTNMVCGLIGSNNHSPIPCIILDLVHQKPADHPMVLATPSNFGCLLHEDQPPRPDR